MESNSHVDGLDETTFNVSSERTVRESQSKYKSGPTDASKATTLDNKSVTTVGGMQWNFLFGNT